MILAESQDPLTGRSAVLEDDDVSVWLYLVKSERIVASLFICNRIAPITERELERYRGGPPPIVDRFASEMAVREKGDRWQIEWPDAGSVLLRVNGIPWCELTPDSPRGRCKGVALVGPWGSPWDGPATV